MTEELRVRIRGDGRLPTLVYLPGLHGDWTLVGAFREALAQRLRFVEITYPRTLDWTLDDYAAGVEAGLFAQGITRGWWLAESFGSQVLWQLLARKRFQAEGVILAGGFARHPMQWAVRLAEYFCGTISLALLTRILFGYARLARFRFHRSPEMIAGLQEFLERRTDLDRRAAQHRLQLVAQNHPAAIVRAVETPVYAITGLIDPVVPWCFVLPWLRRHCPALRESRVIWHADHNVLGTGATAAAEQVVKWIKSSTPPRSL